MSKVVGYARVSTKEQNLARQIEALKKYVAEDMIVTDKASGKDLNRPGYQSLKYGIGKLTSGDTLYIHSLDRLSRNKEDIINELEYFSSIGVRVRVLDLPTTLIDSKDHDQPWVIEMVNKILIEVMTSIAQAERETIKARQAEGISAMPISKNGKRISTRTDREVGRPSIEFPANWEQVYNDWRENKITASRAMQELGLKRNSFYNLAKRYAENEMQSA